MTETLSHVERSDSARAAWSALPHGGHGAVRLSVQCARGHHVAVVYDTSIGPVYAATVRPRSHGQMDLPDEPRGSAEPTRWFDILDIAEESDDELPAWCDCGHRMLSRAALGEWLAAGEKRVLIT